MTVCFSCKDSPSGVVKFYTVTSLYLAYRIKGLKDCTQVNFVIDSKQISLLEDAGYEVVWVVRCEMDIEYALPYSRDTILQWIKE